VGLLIPAYFDPASDQVDWNAMISAASQVPLMAIMNPNNGPGSSASQAYSSNIDAINAAGGKVLGYVHTSYGSRALADAEADVDTFYSWYNVKGIFLDEMANTSTSANQSYYTQLASYIHSHHPGAVIVGNPGASFPEAMITNKWADVFVDAEDIQSNVHNMTQPSWVNNYPATSFAAMSLQTSGDASETAWLVNNRHVGWTFTTTLPLDPNPYGSLPGDFSSVIPAL
jgi:hypothetical protein